MKFFSILILLQLSVLKTASAETTGKQGLGFYSTSNANQTSEASPDTFTQVTSRWTTDVDENPWRYGLTWLNYNKEKANNLLSLSLGAELNFDKDSSTKTIYLPRIVHRNYVLGQAATSDTSFTNTSVGMDVEFSQEKVGRWENTYTLGYEARHYPDLKRIDNEAHAIADFQFEVNTRIQLFALTTGGILISNSSAYSKFFADINFGSDILLSEGWFLNLEILQSQSIYLSRNISQQTEVTNRRGTVVGYSTAKELIAVSTLKADVRYMVNDIFNLQSGVSASSQSSNNPLNNYRSAEIFLSLGLKAP